MPTTSVFDTNFDALTNPGPGDFLDTAGVELDLVEDRQNDSIEAMQVLMGLRGSNDPDSLRFQLERSHYGDMRIEYNGSTWDTYDLKSAAPQKPANNSATIAAAFDYVKTILGTSDIDTNGGRVVVMNKAHGVKAPWAAPVVLRNCHGYAIRAEGQGKCQFIATNNAAMQGTNNVSSTLGGNVNNGATSFTIASATGWPTTNFWAVLNSGERVFCTSRSGTTVTCEAIQTAGSPAFTTGQTVWALGHKFCIDGRMSNRTWIEEFYIDGNSVDGLGGITKLSIAGAGVDTGGQQSHSRVAHNTMKNFTQEFFAQGDYGEYLLGNGTSNTYWDENEARSGFYSTIFDGVDHNRPAGTAMYNSDWHTSQPQILGMVNGFAFIAWGSSGQLNGSSGHIASTLDFGPVCLFGQGGTNSLIGDNLYLDNVGAHKTTLNGTITSGASSLTLQSATNMPKAPFLLLIESEYILVGARSGTSCTSLTRGRRGTTAAGHTTGVNVYTDGHGILIKPDSGQKSTNLMIGGIIKFNGANDANEASDVIYCDVTVGAGTQVRELLIAGGIAGTGSSNLPMRSILNASDPTKIRDVIMGDCSVVATAIVGAAIPYRRSGVNRAETSGGGGGSTLTYVVDDANARVDATFSKTSDTALANTPAVAAMSPHCRYKIRGTVFYDAGATGDLKLQINGPAGATGTIRFTGLPTGAAASTDAPVMKVAAVGAPVSFGGVGAGTTLAVAFEGFVQLGTTGGNVALQAAQDVSNGTATRVFVDSGFEIASVEV